MNVLYHLDPLVAGGDVDECLLRKETDRTSILCVLTELTQPFWVLYSIGFGGRVYLTTLPVLLDLIQCFGS
jgi:hypothetical protein